MQRQRIGELLRQVVPLTHHDVDEILQEQRGSNMRFGETALAMGLCQPEHVWQAWCGQNPQEVDHIDLDELGIDSQAAPLLPRELAVRYGAVAVRVAGNALIVAISEGSFSAAVAGLAQLIHLQIKFVIAPEDQIRHALATYYPA